MSGDLKATVGPGDVEGELAVVLRVENASGEPVELLNPDFGHPSPRSGWPFSTAAYRASLLMSYGYLTITVTDVDGEEVRREALETWATPILRPKVALAPGESLTVPVPVGPFYRLSPLDAYRVTVEYGDDVIKVRAEGAISG
ncbi:hypothetical protein Afil01_10830 [Actinorhabdospora filicis]|uniref:Uncharacterized protein n=1 Tax=Actinorhabdospora filicis TaxID=1785913 RepID=A0A9W6SIQ2_9ACTN|nr:hypothetical protein [Actinorhabdospora filicis]GLZ76276.1 hypothetical protein Afil01_10830 [Actinorhabdospora filicis]